jgi:hypothetical protein
MKVVALSIPLFVSAFIYKATTRKRPCKCTKVDYQKLLKSAARAKLAYFSPKEVEELYKKPVPTNTFENWMLPQLTSLPTFITSKDGVEDAQAYVWKDQDVLYISYRGTSSIQDALADLNIYSHWLNNSVCVHEGFWRQFKSIEEDVQSHITEDITMICMGGHSMGAACAQLAAVVFADRFPNVKFVCHTFGCPRTGNKHFAKWFAEKVQENYRIVNKNDPVPMIPQRPVWLHTSNTCLEITDEGDIYEKTNDTPWFFRLFTSLFDLDYMAPIADHNMSLYIDRLDALYSKCQT